MVTKLSSHSESLKKVQQEQASVDTELRNATAALNNLRTTQVTLLLPFFSETF
jgi:hypothetical protein